MMWHIFHVFLTLLVIFETFAGMTLRAVVVGLEKTRKKRDFTKFQGRALHSTRFEINVTPFITTHSSPPSFDCSG